MSSRPTTAQNPVLEDEADRASRSESCSPPAAEADGTAVDEHVLAAHEREHTEAGDALTALRELARDYDTAAAPCGTHRRLLEALRRFELDLHQHIHEENNVLFPRARAIR